MQNNLLQVLLVESIDTDAQILQGLIENSDLLKFRVHRVSTLKAAIEYLDVNLADVVLLDLNLPECPGMPALKRIVATAPRVPVVVMTREADDSAGINSISSGAQDFVSKIFLSSDIIVRRLLFAHVRHAKLVGLKDAADIDQLTALANRRRFMETFNEVRYSAEHSNQTLALLDVDHFKQLNDQHGHVGGDCALQHLGRLLAREFAEDQKVFRYGGEEFAIILDDSFEVAQRRLDGLLEQIESETFDVESKPLRITASIGATQICSTDTPNDAIQRCDDALYQAKAFGRNRVVFAPHCIELSS